MRSEALPRSARLSEKLAFAGLLRSGRVAKSERFLVQAIVNQQGFARLGMVVGKRVARRAVHRSLLKRLVRETFRRERGNLGSFDLLIRPRRMVSRSEALVAREELRALLKAVIE